MNVVSLINGVDVVNIVINPEQNISARFDVFKKAEITEGCETGTPEAESYGRRATITLPAPIGSGLNSFLDNNLGRDIEVSAKEDEVALCSPLIGKIVQFSINVGANVARIIIEG